LVFPLVNATKRKNRAGALAKHEPVGVRRVAVKLAVSALFGESGEIAPIDAARFGRRAGEIIARAAHRHCKSSQPG
jgi:hypothetical protein